MSVHEIDKIIGELPNKSSHGHDEISNITLKALRTLIIFPLCHIFNEPWMTRGLEEASRTKLKLYKIYLQKNSSDDDHIKIFLRR